MLKEAGHSTTARVPGLVPFRPTSSYARDTNNCFQNRDNALVKVLIPSIHSTDLFSYLEGSV